jgi:hypothetical protein
VIDFARLLEDEIEKFNAFFVDKEEEYIIGLKVLQDRVTEVPGSNEDLMTVGREIVDFHGEMVLLLNYSAFNYIGTFLSLSLIVEMAFNEVMDYPLPNDPQDDHYLLIVWYPL